MMSCQVCGGAVAAPGEVTGFVGQWCTCLSRYGTKVPPALPPVPAEWEEIRRKAIDDLVKQGSVGGSIGPLPAPTPAASKPPTPTSPAMTPAEFVIWLRGYLSAYGTPANMTQGDWKVIAAKLDTLGGPK